MAKVRSDAEIIEQIVRKHFEVLNTIMMHYRGEELPETAKGREAKAVACELGDLVERGLLAPGSRLGIRGRDLNKDATVEVRDGVVGIVLDGQFYTSPSGAASVACGGSRNGWLAPLDEVIPELAPKAPGGANGVRTRGFRAPQRSRAGSRNPGKSGTSRLAGTTNCGIATRSGRRGRRALASTWRWRSATSRPLTPDCSMRSTRSGPRW